MRIKRIYGFPISVGFAFLFTGCPSNTDKPSFDYLRSPIAFRIDTVPAAHPYCNANNSPFATTADCQAAKKYRLSWERPEDTAGFYEYRIFIDTTPPNSAGLSWTAVNRTRALAQGSLAGPGGFSDSVIFILGNTGFQTTTLTRGDSQIVAFDTTARIDSLGRLLFAITTSYRESRLDGQPRYSWIITNDRFAPYPLQAKFTPLDRRIEINWSRPRDGTSFFDPGADAGKIREYFLRITRSGVLNGTRIDSVFDPRIQYINGGTDRSGEVDSLDFIANGSGNGLKDAPGRRFRLPDSQRVFEKYRPDPRDSLHVIVSGLDPQDTVDVTLWAVDSSGNFTVSDTSLLSTIILTDTTQPLKPLLQAVPGSATRNQLAYAFSASRDQVQGASGTLVPADSANANIREYRITRLLLRGSFGIIAQWDTVIRPEGKHRRDTLFIDTLKYLPPGAVFRIFVYAVDSSGYFSQRDSLDDSTLTIRFLGPDSLASCPPGFVPIPAGRFMLGDSSAAADLDEKPPGFNPTTRRFLGSYCIEPYEHRDTVGNFRSRVAWQQASDACEDIYPTFSHLCTEAEWERACETDDIVPLLYGMQSERSFPGGVASTCNIGTDDSAMAFSPTLRDPACLTQEGVFDMSGNLAEWVADPYDSLAYTRVGDTLPAGMPADTTTRRLLHGFRGGYYLKAPQSPAAALRSSRCSNRDYPVHVRPWPYAGCIDANYPQIVVLYSSAAKPPRCLPIPDTLRNKKISAISPSLDSTKLLILIEGAAQPFLYSLPTNDTVYRNLRPFDAKISSRTLAAVTFLNTSNGDSIPDTLDALEMVDTSNTALTAIFSRETAQPWIAKSVGGRYDIKYLYSYLHTSKRGIPAKPHYSNAIIGFRCCSQPRP